MPKPHGASTRGTSSLGVRQLLFALVWAATLGMIIAVLGGDARLVSLELWFTCFIVWLVLIVGSTVLREVPVQTPPLTALWTPKVVSEDEESTVPRPLRSTEFVILRARDNERAFSSQLRPRLQDLADHNLRLTHGIDMRADSERVSQILGETAWLLDTAVTERRPTIEDLDGFLNRIEGDRT